MQFYEEDRMLVVSNNELIEIEKVEEYDYKDFPFQKELIEIEVFPLLLNSLKLNKRECYSNCVNTIQYKNHCNIVYCYIQYKEFIVPHCIISIENRYFDVTITEGLERYSYKLYKEMSPELYFGLFNKYKKLFPENSEESHVVSLDGAGNFIFVRP